MIVKIATMIQTITYILIVMIMPATPDLVAPCDMPSAPL